MKTEAAVAFEPGKPLQIATLDLEGPKAGEVLVEMEACGVCHTDAHSASGGEAWRAFPFVPGHEGCGIVQEVGADVESLRPGDKVIPLYKSECGQCVPCQTGKSNNCDTIMPTQKRGVMLDGTSRYSYRGREVLHYMGCSAFSRYTVAPEISFAKIDRRAPSQEICLMGCAVTTGLGAVFKTARVTAGSSVVVFGLGGIGLSVIQGCRIAKAERIIAVDLSDRKFPLAQQFGATDCIDISSLGGSSAAEAIVEMTSGGCDFAFEAAGAVSAMQDALLSAHPLWGVCCLLGVVPSDQRLSFHPIEILGGRRLVGSTFGGVMGRSELPGYVEMALQGKIDLKPLVTQKRPLAGVNDAIDLMLAGESIRTVLDFQ